MDSINLEQPGSPLPPRAAAQLVIDPPAVVPLGSEHEQSARSQGLLLQTRHLAVYLIGAIAAFTVRDVGELELHAHVSIAASWMSMPRPAMLVATVTAPGTPACAIMRASCAWCRALSSANTFFFFEILTSVQRRDRGPVTEIKLLPPAPAQQVGQAFGLLD